MTPPFFDGDRAPVRARLIPRRIALTLGCLVSFATPISLSAQAGPDRLRLRLDTVESQAVLAILDATRADRAPSDTEWRRLFESEGYVRLKAREAGMKRPFTDSSFAAFVRSDTLARRAPDLRRALSAWELTDLHAAAERAFAYLPVGARIRATVYIVIKPITNSFVWDVDKDPAIFLYLDPEVSAPKFANTVAHELHHIGFSSVSKRADSVAAALPDSVRRAADWMGAFGEGFAMLAAAGGPDVHPHAVSPPAERARWDKDMLNFNTDLRALEGFFLDIIARRLSTPDTIAAVGMTFFGTQGPWYTVGYRMAVVIEQRFGRKELIRCMTDPRRLLSRYDSAAIGINRSRGKDTLTLWSAQLLGALGGDRLR